MQVFYKLPQRDHPFIILFQPLQRLPYISTTISECKTGNFRPSQSFIHPLYLLVNAKLNRNSMSILFYSFSYRKPLTLLLFRSPLNRKDRLSPKSNHTKPFPETISNPMQVLFCTLASYPFKTFRLFPFQPSHPA